MNKSKFVKTKRVDGCDLPSSAFAFVGDPENPATWKLPISFRGDERRTRNHIKNALVRFDEVKGIPHEARQSVWLVICGAAIAHGLQVPHKDFATTSPDHRASLQAEVAAQQINEDQTAAIAQAIAEADALSDKMLRKLGLQ